MSKPAHWYSISNSADNYCCIFAADYDLPANHRLSLCQIAHV
jgi:hypothetical protein